MRSSCLTLGTTLAALTTMPTLAESSPREAHYEIVSEQSSIVAHLLRGGAAKGFAHDHVVRARSFHGRLWPSGRLARHVRAEIEIQAAALRIDEPLWRKRYGMKPLSPSDRKKVSATMHGKTQIDSRRFPVIRFRCCREVKAHGDRSTYHGTLSLHGRRKMIPVVGRARVKANRLVFAGSAVIRQSDFGITPYRAIGGLVRVQDKLRVNIYLVAKPKR